ncbi:MAG: AmpG family muropeptide MFS transporter, partial [Neisseriaceae bacterium]|nr:AmpG family muropeptide MFS transporter [Neisseriaceae bacterium]
MTEQPVNPETPHSQPSLWGQIFSRRMLICVFTGFTSGLPLYVLINLLPAWLRTEGVDLKSIGLFALIGFPFTWKFVWAPLMDRYRLPFLG